MNCFKKFLSVLVALMLAASVCACGGDSVDQPTSDTTENTTTEATQEKETENTTESTAAAEPDYQVNVVDESGNPIAGVLLQMCLETCVPGKTNENGVAEFFLEEADYKVSLLKMPEGFDYATDETEWYFASGETTMTIVLKTIG